jgi:uncharacterized protein YcbX
MRPTINIDHLQEYEGYAIEIVRTEFETYYALILYRDDRYMLTSGKGIPITARKVDTLVDKIAEHIHKGVEIQLTLFQDYE